MPAAPAFVAETPAMTTPSPVDALTDVLHALRLRGAVFIEAEIGAPWSVFSKVGPEDCREFHPAPREVIAYHFVCEGEMALRVEGEAQAVQVRAGDLVILPRNDRHLLGSDLGVPPLDVEQLEHQPGDSGLVRLTHKGQGPSTRFFCGYLGHDNINDPLINALPRVLHLSLRDPATAQWIESSLRFASQPNGVVLGVLPNLLGRLAELLFAEAVRQYLAQQPAGSTGWLAGLADARVGRALALLHRDRQRNWTTEALAREVGLSRSAFAERFGALMDEPPMRYLTRQRMRYAAQRLLESNEPIARIAEAAGYESEPAFHRAFKRAHQMAPAAWRRQHTTRPQDTVH
jgi:AraC-like DNA-binding protein/mannose-6-phosphate isomerase-like protein (cupin superfamily)